MKQFIVAVKNEDMSSQYDPCFIASSVQEASNYAIESFNLGEEVVIYEAIPLLTRNHAAKWKTA